MLDVTRTAMPGIGLSIPQLIERKAEPYVAFRIGGKMSELPQFAPPYIDRTREWLRTHGVEPGGAAFFRYHSFNHDGTVELEVGRTTPERVAAEDGVVSGELPAGRYACATCTGPYDRLYDAFCMLNGWISARELVADRKQGGSGVGIACQLEIYRIGPMDVSDPAQLQTDILIKLT